jgi:SH3 domain protein
MNHQPGVKQHEPGTHSRKRQEQMHMRRPLLAFIPALLLTTLWVFQASWAAQIYVTESRDIILRSTPTNQSRLIAKVPVGTPAEVLKTQNTWSYVRLTESDGSTKEGWLQSRFLGTDPPTDQALEMDNRALKQTVAALEKEKNEWSQHDKDLQERLKITTEKLDKLQADYDALAQGSANYLKVKEERDSIKIALTSAQESVQTLVQENENLKLSGNMRWFVVGALVLLAGWLIGLIMGRSQKKRRTTYRF